MSFWDVVWFIFISYALIAFLILLFSIFSDLFRDRETSGWTRALWIVALVVLPIVTSVVYIVVRGREMAERSAQRGESARQAQDAYIRQAAAASSPADQIAQARAMLDAGTISEPEYERLKEKALV